MLDRKGKVMVALGVVFLVAVATAGYSMVRRMEGDMILFASKTKSQPDKVRETIHAGSRTLSIVTKQAMYDCSFGLAGDSRCSYVPTSELHIDFPVQSLLLGQDGDRPYSFRVTSDKNVVGVAHGSQMGYPQIIIPSAFLNLKSLAAITISDYAPGLSTSFTMSATGAYDLQHVSVSIDDSSSVVVANGLIVNKKLAILFNPPIPLKRISNNRYLPQLYMQVLGVDHDVKKLYFTVDSHAYALDVSGNLTQIEIPTDIVEMTYLMY